VIDEDGSVFEYKSTVNNWNKNLVVTKLNDNKDYEHSNQCFDEFLNDLFGFDESEEKE